ncbi:hypothetical protein [Entomobacter blattae]|uniref:Glycine zipper domain-containing protein n=1 Tax=Entomobacter blattae TaxID=2762277 RepID=A0A7H1NTR0_9PROT|nr:hypothetical protein [Entomobacter blattae]QNT79170.1 hypothetical protein JGUZn3_19650 [Entomobacter blattae]
MVCILLSHDETLLVCGAENQPRGTATAQGAIAGMTTGATIGARIDGLPGAVVGAAAGAAIGGAAGYYGYNIGAANAATGSYGLPVGYNSFSPAERYVFSVSHGIPFSQDLFKEIFH